MRMTLLDSTAIYAFSFRFNRKKTAGRLTIIFRDKDTGGRGTKGRYHKVPADLFSGFLSAPSRGRFHNQMLRGRFDYQKVLTA